VKSLRPAVAALALAMVATAERRVGRSFALFEQGAKARLWAALSPRKPTTPRPCSSTRRNAFIDSFTMQGGAFGIIRDGRASRPEPVPRDGYRRGEERALARPATASSALETVKLAAGFWSPFGSVPWRDPDLPRPVHQQRIDLRMVAIGGATLRQARGLARRQRRPEIRLQREAEQERRARQSLHQSVVDVAHVSLITQGTPWKMAWGAGIWPNRASA
jgi:hypothetical protein